MGFAYRKTGDYEKALEMYDKAIGMAPGFFAEAVEYRAEAYLALNRLDDARQAYLDLFAADRKQADILMATMKAWVDAHRADAAGVDPAAVSAFEKWIGEREGLAKQTRLMAVTARHSGW
jgi:tetratricopeptide (TPR) repeat protein